MKIKFQEKVILTILIILGIVFFSQIESYADGSMNPMRAGDTDPMRAGDDDFVGNVYAIKGNGVLKYYLTRDDGDKGTNFTNGDKFTIIYEHRYYFEIKLKSGKKVFLKKVNFSEKIKSGNIVLIKISTEKEKESIWISQRQERKKDQAKPKKEKKEGGLVRYSWSKSGFNTVAIINSITIRNTSAEECKDIMGIVTFYANSGTELGSNPFIIYEIIAPNETKTFHNINIGFLPTPVDQVTRSDAKILNCR